MASVGGSKNSPDGTLSCSVGKLDRLLKVSFELKPNVHSFIYLNHPKAITNVEWRRTGRYTPRGSVANVLMTSCEDNRVRIWVQTFLPDLVNFKILPHFHLAATIEDENSLCLVTHWINNKEIQITKSLESLLQDMLAKVVQENEQASLPPTLTNDDLDRTLDSLLKEWRGATDLIFSIDKNDGTLNSWQIKYLDGDESGAFRQVQVEKYSSLKSALPLYDASTMSNVTAHWPSTGADPQNILIVTHHMSGVACSWKLNLEQGVELVSRTTGLPISPEWLQDGVLVVRYDTDATKLMSEWIPDEDKPLNIAEVEPFSSDKDYYRASMIVNGTKISHRCHLNQLVERIDDLAGRTQLPGSTKADHLYILSNSNAAAASLDASSEDIQVTHAEDIHDQDPSDIAIDSLDDRGLRFLASMKRYAILTRCLPLKQRGELKSTGIGTENYVWAFHSESQDELIGLIPCVRRDKPEWSELREYGVGWWVKKLELLKKLIEKVAQSAYHAKRDPLDAALFYLAMKKKTLVCALLRRTNCDKRLSKLFEQDFNDPVNKKKALKNAYALLGKHRFEHAAAFFLLAGSIWDTVEVCINKLNDIQLAMTLIRLHDNDAILPANLKRLLETEILGNKNADPFSRSMAHWKLGDYNSAARTLLDGETNASILIFYKFLKDQPLVARHRSQLSENEQQQQLNNEMFHYLATAKSYLKTGNPVLALEVLDALSGDQVNRIRFVACVHILLDELNTLATYYLRGANHDSDCTTDSASCGREQLSDARKFSEWFQKSFEALSKICEYSGKKEPILRTMLTYCSVKLTSEETLHTIRMDTLHTIRTEILELLKALERAEWRSEK